MADITIEAAAQSFLYRGAGRGGPFWVSTTVGYIVYIDGNQDLVYQKTGDGGANWGGAVNIKTGTIWQYDCWADWQTDGDAGTKIHMAYVDDDSDVIGYVYLDTDGDSVGGDDQIEACQGTGEIYNSYNKEDHHVSITKARGGNLAVACRTEDDENTAFYSFYTSPDADTWTSKASPWEASADYIQLYPANLADNQDIWATFWDIDALAKEISLKTYDNSNNDWTTIAEQSISGSMEASSLYLQMDGHIRLSDGHLIFAAWNLYDDAGADLMVWDITDAGTITAKTNIITNEAESFTVSVFVNQVNDDIYVVYVSGTAAGSLTAAFYDKSDDGGGTWGGETAMQADAEDDIRWVSAGCLKAANGGKFLPIWFDDDDNDIFCNTDNGISIAAEAPAGIPVQAFMYYQRLRRQG